MRFKARLVAQGFTQREGVDFNEIFSPVVKHRSIRLVLALVAQLDLELEQMDVKTTFLYGDLEETIYMRQPEGFEVKGKEDQVCLLQRSLYGLKQSPRQWNKRFDHFMLENGFSRSKHDSCVYYKVLTDNCIIYLLLYVDDILIAYKSMKEIQKLKKCLGGEFEMKDLGPARKILGMEINRDKKHKKLFLTQKGYLEKILSKFGMSNAKPVLTPLSTQFKLRSSENAKTEEEIAYMSKIPYANIVGSDQSCMLWYALDLTCVLCC